MISKPNISSGRLLMALAHAVTRFGALRELIWCRSEACYHYAKTAVIWQSFGHRAGSFAAGAPARWDRWED